MVETDTVMIVMAIIGSSVGVGGPLWTQLSKVQTSISDLCKRLARMEGAYESK